MHTLHDHFEQNALLNYRFFLINFKIFLKIFKILLRVFNTKVLI